MTAPVKPAEPPLAEPGKRSTSTAGDRAGAKRDAEDDEDEWRHEPIAPVDEPNPLRSLGKAVGDAVTGSAPEIPAPPKR